MKSVIMSLAVVLFSTSVFAADLCRSAALNAAEEVYGNDPLGTTVKTLQLGEKYHVAVGRGNAEDGEHYYEFIFPNGCSSKPSVRELNDNEKF